MAAAYSLAGQTGKSSVPPSVGIEPSPQHTDPALPLVSGDLKEVFVSSRTVQRNHCLELSWCNLHKRQVVRFSSTIGKGQILRRLGSCLE